MQRNVDLIRSILLAVETNADPSEFVTPKIDGFSEVEVSYHIALMEEAGLISARDRSAIGVYYWSAGQLTFAGHEFLECSRDEAIWSHAKEQISRASGGLSFEVLRRVLVDAIEAKVTS